MSDPTANQNYKYFPSQESDETILLVARKHWANLSAPLIVGIVILFVVMGLNFGAINLNSGASNPLVEALITVFFSLTYLYLVLFVFVVWLIRYLDAVVLTSEHLVKIEQFALFSRRISELDLGTIEDITFIQRGVFATIFKFGDVVVQTAGELPNFILSSFGDPEGLQQKIMEAQESYQNRGSKLSDN